MKLRILALSALLLPALAPAETLAPVNGRQQCLGYLKDGLDLAVYASSCNPAVAQDERYKQAFLNAMAQFDNNCGNIVSEEEAKAFLRSHTGGQDPQRYCAAIGGSVERSLQRYGR